MRRLGRFIKKRRQSLPDIGRNPETGRTSRWAFIVDADDLINNSSQVSSVESGTRFWISEKSLTSIENGQSLPSLPTLFRLAIALQMDPADLFSAAAAAFTSDDMNKYMSGAGNAEDDEDEDDFDVRPHPQAILLA